MRALLFLAVLLAGCANMPAARGPASSADSDIAHWLKLESQKSWTYLTRNIQPVKAKGEKGPRAIPGAVIAAQSMNDPDYYFHWTRDSSVVMKTVTDVADSTMNLVTPTDYERMMENYLNFSAKVQALKAPFGLGEPRFNIDGTVDKAPWSRPQHDGPALRALSVLRFLNKNPDSKWSRMAKQILKKDLEYLVAHYKDPGFDIWEETNADNYQTRLAELAAATRAVDYYKRQKLESKLVESLDAPIAWLSRHLQDMWDAKKGYVRSNLNVISLDKNNSKHTDLDSAVIVAVVETDLNGEKDSVLDPHIEATALKLEDHFRANYPLNKDPKMQPAMGRYPNDLYVNGNPWYLITANFGQLYYEFARRVRAGESFSVSADNCAFVKALIKDARCPAELSAEERKALAHAAIQKGDGFLERVRSATPSDGQLGEQFDKVTGEPRSAPGLTWSYEAILSATLARTAATTD